MSLEVDLYTVLSTDAGVLGAMNGRSNVYLGSIPKGQDDNLAVVIQTVMTDNFVASDQTNLLQMKKMQFDSYAERFSDALLLSNTVKNLLKDLKGSLANTDVKGVIARRDIDMPREPGKTGYVYRRMLELDFWHTDGAGSVPYTPAHPPVSGSNASFLQNLPVSVTPPQNGQALVYNSTNNDWEPGTASGGPGLNFADGETPSGTIDGSNATFHLAHNPNPAASLILVLNRGVLEQGIGYTLSGNTITFQSGYIPQPSNGSDPADVIQAWYRY